MGLRTLVWNADERRPRAAWRVGLILVVTALVLAGVAVVTFVVEAAHGVLAPLVGDSTATVLTRVLATSLVGGAVSLAVLAVGRYVDRRRLADFGFHLDREWWVDLGFGLALGAALMSLVFAVELAAGWVRVTGLFSPRAGFLGRFLALVAIFVVVGVYEELLVRGYLLTNAAEGLRHLGDRTAVVAAVVLSSAAFGLAHANNPNATLVSSLAVSTAGVMLAAGYVLTDDLAVPIGVHTTWNLFQGGVYGFPVSGATTVVAVVAVEQRGPAVFTGGQFGPEAGLLGVGAVLLGTVAVAAWVRLRTGRLRLHPGVVTPALRWRDRDDADADAPPTPATD
ncbi:MAG: lysostaphin resistance A-like protein [Haloplanus sp.]